MNSMGFGSGGNDRQVDPDLEELDRELKERLKNKKRPKVGVQTDLSKRSTTIKELCDVIEGEIIGQEAAKKIVFDMLERLNAGTIKKCQRNGDKGSPIAKLFFAGPTGVGKTQMAKSLQKALNKMFGNQMELVKVNCADFTDAFGSGLSQLKGASMGYIGCDQKAKFHPDNIEGKYRVVLFDEIEKGGEPLWNMLLAILDAGVQDINYLQKKDNLMENSFKEPVTTNGDLVDKNGDSLNNGNEDQNTGVIKAYFKDTIIVMTSNLGTREIQKMLKGTIGFIKEENDQSSVNEKMQGIVNKALTEASRPEFMSRVDYVIPFNFLTTKEYRKILDMFINIILDNLLKDKDSIPVDNVLLEITEDAKIFIVKEVYDKYRDRGVRALPSYLDDTVLLMLAHEINENSFNGGGNKVLLIDAFENKKTGVLELASFIMDIKDCDSDKIIKIKKKA